MTDEIKAKLLDVAQTEGERAFIADQDGTINTYVEERPTLQYPVIDWAIAWLNDCRWFYEPDEQRLMERLMERLSLTKYGLTGV